jgi:ABC-type lipoprotein release transport system permease subunit
MSSLVDAMEVDRISGMVMLWVFVILIFFVVMIYAYLTIYARTKEVGIMRALGTLPWQIVAILMIETAMLAFISVVLGGALGGALAYYFEVHPISFESLEDIYQQYGFVEATLPADFTISSLLKGVLYVLILNLVSVMYPVWQIIRKKPIDAMHHV